jgi:hypothetical protein
MSKIKLFGVTVALLCLSLARPGWAAADSAADEGQSREAVATDAAATADGSQWTADTTPARQAALGCGAVILCCERNGDYFQCCSELFGVCIGRY